MTDEDIDRVIMTANELLTVRTRARAYRREIAGGDGDGWGLIVQEKLAAFVAAMRTAMVD